MSKFSWEQRCTTYRVWIDELTGWEFAPRPVEVASRRIAVEFLSYAGGRYLYGGLGVHFESDAENDLVVEVHQAEAQAAGIESLAIDCDTVSAGLSDYYHMHVFEQICE